MRVSKKITTFAAELKYHTIMSEKVTVFCKNKGISKELPQGLTLEEIKEEFDVKTKTYVLGALVNNRLRHLSYRIYNPKTIEFIEMHTVIGARIYSHTLWMMAAKACHEVAGKRLWVRYPMNAGYYCTVEDGVTDEMVAKIKAKMMEYVKREIKIELKEDLSSVVAEMFRRVDALDVVKLIESTGKHYTKYYMLDGYFDFYPTMIGPNTKCIDVFDVIRYEDGIMLVMPDSDDIYTPGKAISQPHTFSAHKEYYEWNAMMGLHSVGDMNELVTNGGIRNMMKVAEALHEKKIASIAETIKNDAPKFVMIAGPSSSGKTTFSKRLEVQLQVCGIHPQVLSLDNYFVERDQTPKDEKGEYDFEHFKALDIDLLNDNLRRIMNGEEIEVPTYVFSEGTKKYLGNTVKLDDDQVLIMEGIHALNPDLLPNIPPEMIFKIYIAPMTAIAFDDHNWLPVADIRLIRRIVRDNNFRAYTAAMTIKRWHSVRAGERKWITPFQEDADVMFNSAQMCELAVMKDHVEPLLRQVPETADEYIEARRLLEFLEFFKPVADKELPPTSLLREFLGGSSFHY